jgi:hypothetical protein
LSRHGDASSIPYLQAAIADRPAAERGPDMICTWFHAFDALARSQRAEAAAGRSGG